MTSFYKDKWGKMAIYENDFTLNVNLQLTYAGEPALEEVDVVARAILIDPDGIPGTGDEYFETVQSGGVEIVVGEDTLRRDNLDTTFRTSLQITY